MAAEISKAELAKIEVDDPVAAAVAAGLRHVSDDDPGIRRRRRGKGWSYHRPDGETIRDPEVRERIESLAIPPAWEEVWICPTPTGHVQATGRDRKGRKQYRYHPRWRARHGTRPSSTAWWSSARRCRRSAAGCARTSRARGCRGRG